MKKSLSNLLVVGSVAYDSLETPFGKVNKTLGGSGSYFSLAASYFLSPQLVGVVGSDFKPADFKTLRQHKIDISGVAQEKGKTFHWAGKYNFDLSARETLKTELGVFAGFNPQLSNEAKKAQYVFLGNIHPKLQANVFLQAKGARFVGLDTMNYWIEKALADLKKVLKLVNILIINDGEARELTKEHNLLKAAAKIRNLMKPAASLIIKQGEHGLLLFGRAMIFHLPGYPLEDVIDPTGAGDSFAGGFMGYLAKSADLSWPNLKKACVAGSVMASFCCERLGTKGLLNLTDKKIAQRIKAFEGLTRF